MAASGIRTIRIYTATIANGASQSESLDLTDVVGGSYFVPSAFTNVGATNLMRFGVSSIFPEASGTDIIALLPTTTIATAQSQRQTVSTWYPFLPDVFKFRSARFDGVTTEGAARSLVCWLIEGYVTWKNVTVGIANGATASDVIELKGARGGSVLIPAAFTGTTVTWNVSADGGTYTPLNDTADADISSGVAVDRWIPIPDGAFAHGYLKVISGSAEGAARVLRVDLKYVG